MITFSYEVLEERISMLNEWFDRCYFNLNRHQKGTPAHKKWLDDCLHVMRQIFMLEDMAKTAPKESELKNKQGWNAALTATTQMRSLQNE